jgi:signal transduction histidine kinase
MSLGRETLQKRAFWQMQTKLRSLLWLGFLLLLAVPGIWLGTEMRATARIQAEQQLQVEAESMVAALEYGDLPWLNKMISRKSPEFSGRDRRIATGAGQTFGGFGSASDRAALERVPVDQPTMVRLSTGAARVLRKSANSYPAIADQGYGDVMFTVARAYPSQVEEAANITVFTALTGLLAVALTALGISAWYSVNYRQRLAAVNTHLGSVGKGAFDQLDFDGSIPEEIEALKRNVNTMIGELSQQFSGLQSFVAVAAHELRTPLTRMRLSVERMRNNPSEDRVDDLDRIQANSAGLLALLEGLLELGKYQIERFNVARFERITLSAAVAEFVEDVEESFAANGKHIEADITPGITVSGELPLVRRLVENLLENARKYGAVNSAVSVNLRHLDGQFELKIESVGGFPEDIRETAFIIGRRSAEVANKPGLGLGLSLVDIVARKHGWRVALGGSVDVARVTITGAVMPAVIADIRSACG